MGKKHKPGEEAGKSGDMCAPLSVMVSPLLAAHLLHAPLAADLPLWPFLIPHSWLALASMVWIFVNHSFWETPSIMFYIKCIWHKLLPWLGCRKIRVMISHLFFFFLWLDRITHFPYKIPTLSARVIKALYEVIQGQNALEKIFSSSFWQRVLNPLSISTQFLCWNPNAQCDGIRRWGLWEVLSSRGWG